MKINAELYSHLLSFSLNLSPSPATNKIMEPIKTVKHQIADKVQVAAYQAAISTLAKYKTDNEDFLLMAFGEAFFAASKIATGDNFSQLQFYKLVKHGYNVAIIEFQG